MDSTISNKALDDLAKELKSAEAYYRIEEFTRKALFAVEKIEQVKVKIREDLRAKAMVEAVAAVEDVLALYK